MNDYSPDNPPPVKVGDLLYLNLGDESGFGVITDIYQAQRKRQKRKMMKVFWPNVKTRLNKHQDHDIYRVSWNNLIYYYGQ